MEPAFTPFASFGGGLAIGSGAVLLMLGRILGATGIVSGLVFATNRDAFAWRAAAPLFGVRFVVPTGTAIDRNLAGGSALFGIGWGIAGFCQGAAMPALGTGRWEVALFLGAAIAVLALHRAITPTTTPTAGART